MLDNTIKVSVLMTVYNTPFEQVKRAIKSVLQQTYQQFELIIINDGSNTLLTTKLMAYCQLYQHKIHYTCHPNCGQSESINKGVQLSNGSYIAIIDADDEYKPNHLQVCMQYTMYAQLTYANTITIANTTADYYVPDKYDNTKNIHVDNCKLFATFFGEKKVFETIPFNTMYAADSFFYDEVIKQFKVAKRKERTYIYYRNNPNSITNSLKNKLQTI